MTIGGGSVSQVARVLVLTGDCEVGLPISYLRLMLDEAKRESFHGAVGVLGRQAVYFTMDQLRAAAADRQVPLSPTDVELSWVPQLAEKGYVSDRTVFRALGFDVIESIDKSNFEEAEVLTDLNLPVGPDLHQRYDLLVDFGTIEHIFHMPQLFSNLHAMLRPGGRIIHITPSSNWVDHGFWMVSPTLFWDYYSANQYAIRRSLFLRGVRGSPALELMEYHPGALNEVRTCGLDNCGYSSHFVVQKLGHSTGNVIPQQGCYLEIWAAASGPAQSAPPDCLVATNFSFGRVNGLSGGRSRRRA